MQTKIQIKSILGSVLFELEKENNTIKDTIEEAVKSCADLSFANLSGADLHYANLHYANLRDANLSGANLSDADLRDADLYGADLRGANLYGADLRCADLHYANLHYANLRDTDLRGADLSGADLRDANLRDTDLRGATLSDANLSDANLRGADLSFANLSDANLSDANLSDADLRGANLYGADLRGATKVPFVPFACPSEGTFMGWKKVRDYLIKLEIPEDAKRCSATTNKCRCDKAKVLSITNIKNGEEIQELCNNSYSACVYKVGEMVYPDKFDDDRWNECSNGIHFFINKQEAINY